MRSEFLTAVQSTVGPLLDQLGFQLDSFDGNVDEGGRLGSVAFFGRNDCKIQVYRSTRAGSVNCTIAPIDAPNVFGPYDYSKKWQYLARFAIK